MRGRFAPSPTGQLHVGNLRTALFAGLSAASQGGELIVRMEDLDPVTSSRRCEAEQLADLGSIGIVHHGSVVRQSERFHLYRQAIDQLDQLGLVYRCFCTRREIREAAAAPNGPDLPDGAYPGTCRNLAAAQVRSFERDGRPAALRLRTESEQYVIDDLVAGRHTGRVDDVVLQRTDAVPAYNLAVVVDDHLQGVTEVVRGDDLLSSTPRQMHLQRLLGLPSPAYGHVPLVVGTDGVRLAKRHGAITLFDLAARGVGIDAVVATLAASAGLCDAHERPTFEELVARFDIRALRATPWRFSIDQFFDTV
jgi:glutamyl-tRNA synthetase